MKPRLLVRPGPPVALVRLRARRQPSLLVCLIAAVVVSAGGAGYGQQPGVPQTGAPRQLWPQRPGTFQPLNLPAPVPGVAQPQAAVPAQVDEPEFVPNEVLVQFEPGTPDETRAAARAAADATLRTTMGPDGRLEWLTTRLDVPDAIGILEGIPQVEFAGPNWIVRHDAVSDDPYYTDGSLWGMYGDATTPANEFGSQAGEAWAQGNVGSQSVYVAVIDEGIDINHPDLAPNIWTNPFDPVNGLDDDGNGMVDDVHGWDFYNDDNSVYDGPQDDHGTHVAGIIGARGGNGEGVAGVSWRVTLISAKFLGAGGGTNANAIRALDYLIDLRHRHGLNIVAVNSSWGGGSYDYALHAAIIRAAKAGILFITSAGNGGPDLIGDNNDIDPHYPSNYSTLVPAGSESAASYDAVIAVAALTRSGGRSSFSNYGPTTVDIGAPGGELLPFTPATDKIISTWPGGGYRENQGTSMAAPHVTGAVVLYKTANPDATPAEIRDAIIGFGTPTPSMAGITTSGRRLNVSEFASPLHLSVNDAKRIEGNSGTSNVVFTVSLSAASAHAVTVRYVTSDITTTTSNTTSFSNPGSISIPSISPSVPYPSTITVPSGLGVISKVRVALNGFSHTYPDDVDVLLVGPGGQKALLMSDVGGGSNAVNLTLTFDDAGQALPDEDGLASGTYRPTDFVGLLEDAIDPFDDPAPAGPYATSLAAFNGVDPAGTWSLFVTDDFSSVDGGSVAGGWTLELTTRIVGDYDPSPGLISFPPGTTSQPLMVPVVGDLVVEPSETFRVTLFDAFGAAIRDAEAIGTIVNDDFTDLSLSGLPIRAIHVAELRTAINEARMARGLGAFPFTDGMVPQVTPVRALHIEELRAALLEAYAQVKAPPPSFSDSSIIPGVTVIRGAHIQEIRAALVNLP